MNEELSQNKYLLIHPEDNVLVVLEENGSIEFGHKIARYDIARGQNIIKYGSPIGIATANIARGDWVHTHNVRSALKPAASFQYSPQSTDPAINVSLTDNYFAGYRRNSGKVGIRNEIWIVPTVGCVNRTAEKLAAYGQKVIQEKNIASIDSVQAWTHPYGCSQLGEDHINTRKILAGLAAHPNAGGVLLLGLGCENNQMEPLLTENILQDRENLQSLVVQEVSDELARGRQLIDLLIKKAANASREKCAVSDLIVGLKCGGSDSFSGLTANPLLGRFSDWLTTCGGSVVLSEIPEFFGAEEKLLNRSANREIFTSFTSLLQSFRDNFTRNNLPVYENPSPGNRRGGITTLEEKSLGCVEKAGQAAVKDILNYGEQIKNRGLAILEGPGNDIVACTAMAAAGAQLLLFTTGRGTPLGGPVPTVKIASNADLSRQKPHWIDLTAWPPVISNPKLDNNLINLVINLASGLCKTRNEENNYREISIYKHGITL